jgi:DNA-binding IclR family transcriptional regulator
MTVHLEATVSETSTPVLRADSAPRPGTSARASESSGSVAFQLDGSKDRQFVTALARGLDILRAFHAGDGMLGNQEIAARTSLPKPTVARLTHTLTQLGYLNYARRFRKYELGASVLALGYAALSNLDIRQVARPHLQALANYSNASVALAGRDRLSMIYLECCRGQATVALTLDVGSRVPVPNTTLGRAYIAALPERERTVLLDTLRKRWRDDWSKVKTGIEKAEREIAQRGFCLSIGEWLPEINAVGVPLRGPDGSALYALNCAGPSFSLSRERLERDIGPRLVQLARDVQLGLAKRPTPDNVRRLRKI